MLDLHRSGSFDYLKSLLMPSTAFPASLPRPLAASSAAFSRSLPEPATDCTTDLLIAINTSAAACCTITPPDSFPMSRRWRSGRRSEEHTSELQSLAYLVCRLLLEKKKTKSM